MRERALPKIWHVHFGNDTKKISLRLAQMISCYVIPRLFSDQMSIQMVRQTGCQCLKIMATVCLCQPVTIWCCSVTEAVWFPWTSWASPWVYCWPTSATSCSSAPIMDGASTLTKLNKNKDMTLIQLAFLLISIHNGWCVYFHKSKQIKRNNIDFIVSM